MIVPPLSELIFFRRMLSSEVRLCISWRLDMSIESSHCLDLLLEEQGLLKLLG